MTNSDGQERNIASDFGKFLRENGGWAVAILGGLSAFFGGGMDWPQMLMIGLGGALVVGAQMAGPSEEEQIQTASSTTSRSRDRDRERGQELELQQGRSTTRELELELASAADSYYAGEELGASSRNDAPEAQELSFLAPGTTPEANVPETEELSFRR